MFDAYRGCTLPKMRLGARTSNRESAKTKKKIPDDEEKMLGLKMV